MRELLDRAGAGGDDLRATLEALRPDPAKLLGCFPFAHPRHWGGFRIVGRSRTHP